MMLMVPPVAPALYRLEAPATVSIRSTALRSSSARMRDTSRSGVFSGTPSSKIKASRPRKFSDAPEMV